MSKTEKEEKSVASPRKHFQKRPSEEIARNIPFKAGILSPVGEFVL